MRIGLPGLGRSVDHIVEQAERAEADGFTSLWYASATAGDPLVPMALHHRGEPVSFGEDRPASRDRTRALLKDLAAG